MTLEKIAHISLIRLAIALSSTPTIALLYFFSMVSSIIRFLDCELEVVLYGATYSGDR